PAGGRAMTSLDPLDLGVGVVAVDPHVPGVTEDAGLDLHAGVVDAHADQRGAVGLAPDLAVVERVAAALLETAEFARDPALDRFVRAEVEEAAVLGNHFLLCLHGSLLGGL